MAPKQLVAQAKCVCAMQRSRRCDLHVEPTRTRGPVCRTHQGIRSTDAPHETTTNVLELLLSVSGRRRRHARLLADRTAG